MNTSSPNTARLRRVQSLAKLLDRAVAIPGSKRFGIGLDSLLGLVPGLGDLAGLLISSYIVLQGFRMGAPLTVLMRMLGNIGIDALVGVVPVVGDLFDIAWQANLRNVALLERHIDATPRGKRQSMGALALLGLALLALAALVITAAVALIGWLVQGL